MSYKRAYLITSAAQDGAENLLDWLQDIRDRANFEIESAATLSKDAKGHIHVDDKENVNAGEGTLAGAFAGTLIGAIVAGVPGAIVGAGSGAVTGAASAATLDFSFDQDQLKRVAEQLNPTTSALLVVLKSDYGDAFEASIVDEFQEKIRYEYFDLKEDIVEKWNDIKQAVRNTVN